MNDKTIRVLEYEKIIEMLVDKAQSSLGKKLAKELKPVFGVAEVEKLQCETDEAVKIIIRRANPPLGGIHDISSEIRRAEIGATLSPGGLLMVADTLRAARRLKNFIKQDREDKGSKYPIIEELIGKLYIYRDIEESIFNAIISEEEISDNASNTLRNIRRQIESKNLQIRNKLNSIINSQKYKKYLQEAIVTIREDRFVVPVKQEYKSSFPGLVHDQSASGATLFIEPMAVVELNNQLKELKVKEKQEIERILAELTEKVASVSNFIKENQKVLSKLDFIFAKGKLALDMDATKPVLNDNGYLKIKKARHPLLDKETVVPIDVYLGKDINTLVITGPNTGGKTVTLKTIGLLTLMAQAGLHIPVEHGSEIAVFDSVFADIGDEQSIEQSLSTFSSHMTNIVDILKSVRKNSLVLFDELGAGTDPTEGAALAMSILDYLYNKGVRTVATTHYSELKVYALSTKGIENASVEFDVETLSPTYRLLIGVPGKSNAFEISKRLGLQDFIIKNAKEMLSKESVQFEDVLAKIEKDRKITEENRQETEKLRKEVESLKEKLAQKKEKLDKNRERIIREAKSEARKVLLEAKEEANSIIKELRNISDEVGKERNKKIQQAKDKLKKNIDDIENDLTEAILAKKNTKPPEDLKPGDSVKILNLNQKGTVVTSPDAGGNLMVQAGIMKISVHISNLKKTKSDDESKASVRTKTMVKTKTKSIKTELDLRGMTLEEAMLDVDKYLDDAYIAGLNEVTIIHGKGTGVLREGISQLLRGHRHVKNFRLGKYGEGGSGVTVVTLK
ncbi:endonuclease MutS2 [Caldisalinibacter kiritimatiensis]|uniref:Endonuclease MutS2 n=1 Tax=Caldisalinibacter kiritimatiensis TaxID=1304284 RepID=R1AUV3_9FIRM|nr:endonuclease MutS2 [Caldisalinibacter kiritimatiensis]EOD00928.1 Recombination inhibitory protein MutS2 [Caldisalinibacter kiritimatiensis]